MKIDNFKRWLNLKSLSEKTKHEYISHVKRFFSFSDVITKESLEDFILHLKKQNRSKNCINLYLNALRNYCKSENIDIEFVECAKIKRKKHNVDPYFSVKELKNIIKYIPLIYHNEEQWKIEERKLILKFLFYTGIRAKKEYENMMVEHLHFKNDKIIIENGKGEKTRYVPFLNDELKKQLWKKAQSKNGKLFDLPYHTIRNMFNKIKEELSLEGRIEPRTMRRSFGYFCVDKGYDVTALQQMMGHEDIKTTLIYYTSTEQMIKDKAKKIRNENK